jgi:hypothetical protein
MQEYSALEYTKGGIFLRSSISWVLSTSPGQSILSSFILIIVSFVAGRLYLRSIRYPHLAVIMKFSVVAVFSMLAFAYAAPTSDTVLIARVDGKS